MKAQGREVEERRVVWTPRPHQKLLRTAFRRGIRWQAHVWHRRAGKTAACMDLLAGEAMQRPGNYWFLTPKLTQVRTAIWDSRRADGLREIDVHFPAELRSRTSEEHLLIELVNGSAVRFLGSDNFNRLVGANVHGIVFDEFALADPAAWDYFAPILLADPAKRAWAVFISTYRGRNHWWRMFRRVKDDPAWATSLLTIDDTVREDGAPIVTAADIERERAQGKAEEYLRQEYYCDPLAAFDGAFYGQAMRAMQDENRIGPVLYDPSLPVTTSVDLGYADELAFGFYQHLGNEERCVGSCSWKFTKLAAVIDEIRGRFPWGKRPGKVVLPHDGRFGAAEVFQVYGYEPIVLPRTKSVPAEIENVRAFMDRLRIDNVVRPWTGNEENNARFIEALQGYRTLRSSIDHETHQKSPAHTWHGHFADQLRYYVTYRGRHSAGDDWGPAPNYSQHDRAVVGAHR
ncbi:MAG TPA: terminase family protein [Casimicrobiaceae bacterium]|nr:terminase family protein [Casimicrobiaceae bacterium]